VETKKGDKKEEFPQPNNNPTTLWVAQENRESFRFCRIWNSGEKEEEKEEKEKKEGIQEPNNKQTLWVPSSKERKWQEREWNVQGHIY
jgi:hypothetical protein